jgi:beta-phosphoglucomutase-like phosphatase (HAD superfamily)
MCSVPVDETTAMPLPIRKSVRQMRWFEHSFRAQMAATSTQIGVDFHLSDRLLADTFLSWHRVLDSHKPASRMVRRSYVGFAAGTMFHELLRKNPVSVHQKTGLADPRTPALLHPEEYLYATYCHTIRQAILGQDFWLDTRKPHRLNDINLWQEFTKTITANRTAAIGFLAKLANEPQPAQLPMTSHPAGGFGNRLWKLAERHAQPDLPDHGAPTEFGLRLVSDNVPLRLPASTRLILITFEGVAAQTDQIDTEELCILLNEYNAKLTPEQTRERFFGHPISAAMTYVGERTGQLCPSGFVTKLDQRIIARDRWDLDLMPGLQTLLQRLFDGGVDVGIVSHGRRRRIEAAQNLPALSELKSVGPIHMLTPENRLATIAKTYGHSPRNTLLIDASSTGIAMAHSAFMPAFGFAPKARIDDKNILRFAGAQAVLSDLDSLICAD